MKRIRIVALIPLVIGLANAFAPMPLNIGEATMLSQQLISKDAAPVSITESNGIATSKVGKLMFLLPNDAAMIPSQFGAKSPVDPPSLYEAAKHLARKANWYADGQLDWDICFIQDVDEAKFSELCRAEILIAFGLSSVDDLPLAQRVFEARREMKDIRHRISHFAVDCGSSGSNALSALVGPYDPLHASLAAQFLPWTAAASGRRMHHQLLDIFARHTSDDFCYGLMLFLNQFSGTKIDWVRYRTDASWEKGPLKNAQEFYAMMTKCGSCIVPCLKDAKCRACLSKMTKLDPRDQATSYRTLVSYESELLTNISRCIFTKHNIFQCYAKIPDLPPVSPMTTWRGQPVTEAIGRALLVGHLDGEATAPEGNQHLSVSWMVACGANVAYDQFPSQHQLFYPTAKGRDLWYDPVFRVQTLDGRNVWCHRHYKVRPYTAPATFLFSTFDNGVTSDERWTILGAADDLSWLVVHYAGAAKTVGLQYLGGLVCTPDGALPPDAAQLSLIWHCLQQAGIQPWELTVVDNQVDSPNYMLAGPPPLDVYRTKIAQSRQQAQLEAAAAA
jgi:VDE lipocalin domain